MGIPVLMLLQKIQTGPAQALRVAVDSFFLEI
jgi:hypothetical protein